MRAEDREIEHVPAEITAAARLSRALLPGTGDDDERTFAAVIAKQRRHRVRAAVWASVGFGGALAAMAAGWALVARPARVPEAPLTFTAQEVNGELDQGALATAADKPKLARFSDGTEIEVQPSSVARVIETTAAGARLDLARGGIVARVHHRDHARWAFSAGPYTVHVTGTAFSLEWEPDERRLSLAMREGAVFVTGPRLSQGVTVRGSERLVLRDGSPAEGAPAEAPARPPEPARTTSASTARPPLSWSEQVANGNYDAVIAHAEGGSLPRTLARASTRDLAALADAARYRGKLDLARQTLVVQRRRFSGTPAASDAAFLLGRLAQDQRAQPGEALRWFEAYLRESPRGVHAPEAAGRRVLLASALLGADAARSLAREYLAEFPTGSYARAARAIVDAPSR